MALSRRSTARWAFAAFGLATAVALGFAAVRASTGGSTTRDYTVRSAGQAGKAGKPKDTGNTGRAPAPVPAPEVEGTADVGVTLVGHHSGGRLTFRVTVTNQGDSLVRSVLVHADVSPAVAPSSADCRTGRGIVNCGFVALPAGQQASSTFSVPATGDPVTVTISGVSTIPADPDHSGDWSMVTIT